MPDEILRLDDVIALTKLSKTSIYGAIRSEGFPKPLRLTKRARGWRASEVAAWLESRERVDFRAVA